MTECIKIFNPGTPEHDRLTLAAALMNIYSPRGYRYYVGETYFDYGQGWRWTTVLCDDKSQWGGYQALNPREQEEIITGNDVKATIDKVFADKYCPDRI